MFKANQDNILLDGMSTARKVMRQMQQAHDLSPVQLSILLVLASISYRSIPYLTGREIIYYTWNSEFNEIKVYEALNELAGDEARHLIEKRKDKKTTYYNITPNGLTIVKHCITLSKEFTEDYNTLAQSI